MKAIELADEDRKYFSALWRLPCREGQEAWEHLYIGNQVKEFALNTLISAHTFRQKPVSHVRLPVHGMLFLYGEPGTGKTTLALGLADQAARYFSQNGLSQSLWCQVNSHGLVSHWLGQTPKAVDKLFSRLEELASTEAAIFVILDEIENLATNRAASLSEANPVDVYRGVNSFLEGFDRIKRLRNVLIISTSNLPKGVEPAFQDRADLSLYVPLPGPKEREAILRDTLKGLQSLGLRLEITQPNRAKGRTDDQAETTRLVRLTKGWSGRRIRKAIFSALAARRELIDNPDLLGWGDILDIVRSQRRQEQLSYRRGGVYVER